MEFLIIVVLAAILAVILLITLGDETSRLPEILSGATLFANEQNIQISKPVNLSGRPDQVWKATTETLVIVDTKVRQNNQIYESDRIQLSAYAIMLKNHASSKNMDIHPIGYIRRYTGGNPKYIPVKLYDEEKVVKLHERYWQVKDEELQPLANGGAGLCHHCGHRKTCVKFK